MSTAVTGAATGAPSVDKLAAAALDERLAEVIDLVYYPVDDGVYRIQSREGSVVFSRSRLRDATTEWRVEAVEGANPVADQRDEALLGADQEQAAGFLDPSSNTFPNAYGQVAQLFDADHAPDLVLQHHPAHSYGGNIGQHGSLAINQARAPFIAAGAGLAQHGELDRSMRMVDVAPTILRVLGVEPLAIRSGEPGNLPETDPLYLLRQDGAADTEIFCEGGARRVQVILLDGVNPNALRLAMESGRCPNLSRLAGEGVSLRRGLLASAPTATLANHTTANTGMHPGHSGVLNHSWLDRRRDVRPELLEMPEMFNASSHLASGVETLHEATHRHRPDAFTFASFEFCDRGADASSFGRIRDGMLPNLGADPLDGYHSGWIESCPEYGFMSQVDERALIEATEWWEQTHGNPLPTFGWISLSVTDEAGHVAGPYAEMTADALTDSDRRIGRLLDAIERAGAIDETAVLVFSDHGMAGSDPSNTAGYDSILRSTGIPFEDVADGLIYLR